MSLSNAGNMKMPNYSMSNLGVRSVKSSVWLIFTVFFGLLPMVLVWVDVSLINKNFPFEEFVINGSFMFFATAVVASVTVDYILSEKFSNNWNWNFFEILTPKNWSVFEIFTLFLFPLLILIACVILFYIPYYRSNMIKIELLKTIEFYILLTTLIYSFVVKFFAFK